MNGMTSPERGVEQDFGADDTQRIQIPLQVLVRAAQEAEQATIAERRLYGESHHIGDDLLFADWV